MSEFPSLGTVGGPDYSPRTMSQAGVAAESQAFNSARGRGWMTTAECVAMYRDGQDDPDSQPICSRDLGCSAGRMRAANFKEDDMGKSNYGKCVECGRKGNRDSAGRCYHAACKVARNVKPAMTGTSGPVEVEFDAIGEGLGTDRGGGQEGIPDTVTQDEHAAIVSEDVIPEGAASRDHIEDSRAMVDLPDLDDLTGSFVLSGITFEPLHKLRIPGENRVSIRKSSIGISAAADQEHDLSRFSHARYTVSVDGKALAIKCLDGPKGDAVKIERNNGGIAISAVPLARKYPHLVGQRAALESTELSGWFVVRFGAES